MSVIQTYSKLASKYESRENLASLWGKITERTFCALQLKENPKLVVEVGCGPGLELASLVESGNTDVQFIGVEPAENLRISANEKLKAFGNAEVLDGKFEELPLESASVDHLYSILAFHWTKDLNKSVQELARVLKPDGHLDLLFIGKDAGKDFLKKISPIYFKKLSARQVLDMASERQRLTAEEVEEAFRPFFADRKLEITETFETFYDTLEGHWSWWCRIEGQFATMSQETRKECDDAAREALKSLETENGIPYTAHLFHVSVR